MVTVRPTRLSDLERVTDLHAAAFAGEIGPLAGRGYLTAFLRWFMTEPSAVSLVAEVDGQIVGYVLGAPDGYAPGLTRKLMPVIALGVARNLLQVVAHPSFRRQVRTRLVNLALRREPKSVIFERTPPGCFNLVGIGTDPGMRGKGVGKALVEALVTHATGRTVLLDVFTDNTAARTLYARCGFEVLVEEGRVVRMLRRSELGYERAQP